MTQLLKLKGGDVYLGAQFNPRQPGSVARTGGQMGITQQSFPPHGGQEESCVSHGGQAKEEKKGSSGREIHPSRSCPQSPASKQTALPVTKSAMTPPAGKPTDQYSGLINQSLCKPMTL